MLGADETGDGRYVSGYTWERRPCVVGVFPLENRAVVCMSQDELLGLDEVCSIERVFASGQLAQCD